MLALNVLCKDGHDIGPEEDGTVVARSDGQIPPTATYIPSSAATGLGKVYFVDSTNNNICLPPSDILVKTKNNACGPPFAGGLYKDFPAPLIANQGGCERHHMPVKASYKGISPYAARCGPVIIMTREDHMLTGSHGGVSGSGSFRNDERTLILNGDFIGAFEHSARDIQGTFTDGRYAAANNPSA